MLTSTSGQHSRSYSCFFPLLLSKSPFTERVCLHHLNVTTFAISTGYLFFFFITGSAIQYSFSYIHSISLSLNLYIFSLSFYFKEETASLISQRMYSQKCNLFHEGIPLVFFHFLPLSCLLLFFASCYVFSQHIRSCQQCFLAILIMMYRGFTYFRATY